MTSSRRVAITRPHPLFHARPTVVALLFALLACEPPEAAGPAPKDPPLRGIVWVVLDATPAAALGIYGHHRDTSPNIDRVASEAMVFERAYAQAPVTVVSAASFLTSRYPWRSSERGRLVGPTLADLFAQHGFRTAAFSENPWVSPAFGFDRGFGTFHLVAGMESPGSESLVGLRIGRRDSQHTVDQALSWIGSTTDRFFLYVHLLPPHAPYDPPPPFRGRFAPQGTEDGLGPAAGSFRSALEPSATTPEDLASTRKFLLGGGSLTDAQRSYLRSRYEENLAYVDEQVGRLVAGLRRSSLLEQTILVIASDHGEAFGEHGNFFHASSLYDEQIRVPLIIRLPGAAGRIKPRSDHPVELVDIGATLLEAFELPGADTLDGESLLKSVRSADTRPGTAISFLGNDAFAVMESHWKLIASHHGLLLFDLAADPAELVDLAGQRPDVVQRLRASATHLKDSEIDTSGIDASTKAQLQALGYLLGDGKADPPASDTAP